MSARVAARQADDSQATVEQSLLAAWLLDAAGTWAACSDRLLEGGLFKTPAHRAVAEVLLDRCQAGELVDPVLVDSDLRQSDRIPDPVPPGFVASLVAGLGTPGHARHYADKLAALAEHDAADDLDGLSVGAALAREEHRLEAGPVRIPTGWPRLDAALGGGLIVPSLTVLGAGPKSGKSTWARIVATRHVEAGGVAYVLDLENGPTRYLRRTLCRHARLGGARVAAALRDECAGVFAAPAEAGRWREALRWARETLDRGLYVEFRAPPDLEGRIAALRRLAGHRELLVVVDSLQRLPVRDMTQRRAGIDEWVGLLERLRYQYNAAMLVISEIRRGRDGYAAREDTYKESGGIEYAADLAMTLSRPAADEDTDAPSTLRIELARDGDEDPRGDVASYRAVRPHYDLEEVDPERRSPRHRGPTAEKADAARDFLRDLLAGGAVSVTDAMSRGKAAGFSETTLQRAKRALGAQACMVGLRQGWRLP